MREKEDLWQKRVPGGIGKEFDPPARGEFPDIRNSMGHDDRQPSKRSIIKKRRKPKRGGEGDMIRYLCGGRRGESQWHSTGINRLEER